MSKKAITCHNYNFAINEMSNYSIPYIHSQLGIEYESLKIYDDWIEINGKWYYVKRQLSEYGAVNELLGVKLADYFKLDTAKYNFIDIKNEQEKDLYNLVSENFREEKYNYFSIIDESICIKTASEIFEFVSNIRKLCDDDRNFKKLYLEVMKMVIIDFYSSQADRHYGNFLLKEYNSEYSMAPLFDYELSFSGDPEGHRYISNTFLEMSIEDTDFRLLFKECPVAKDILESSLDINILNMIKELEAEHFITISDELKEYYKGYTKKRSGLIKETIKYIS